MVATFMQVGAAISHWNHHRFTNQEGDPDIPLFSRYRTLWQRMLFARMAANRQYQRNTFRMAFGRPVAYATRLPFSEIEVRLMAWLNIVLSALWVVVYAWIIYRSPLAGALAIGAPHIFGILYTGLRSYLEHAGTGTGMFHDSRSRISLFFSVAYFFNNYHLEHHLYPYIPCYRLGKVHRYLRQRGYYAAANSPVQRGILRNYAFATSRFQYPQCRRPRDSVTESPGPRAITSRQHRVRRRWRPETDGRRYRHLNDRVDHGASRALPDKRDK
jgi:fatty acid desaturase